MPMHQDSAGSHAGHLKRGRVLAKNVQNRSADQSDLSHLHPFMHCLYDATFIRSTTQACLVLSACLHHRVVCLSQVVVMRSFRDQHRRLPDADS